MLFWPPRTPRALSGLRTLTRLCQGSGSIARMRDYLAATRERVVVFDGGMGATLEQFDLSLEHDYGGLPGKCHEVLVLNRPDVIEGVHASMVEAGAEVVETDTLPGQPPEARGVGPGRAHARDQPQRRREIARKAVGEHRFVAGSIGPTGYLPASDDPTLGQISFRELVDGLRGAGARPGRGRRRPAHHRDGAGHPRGQGGDLRRARGVQGARALRADPDLGLAAAQRRQDAAGHRHQRRAGHARGAARSTRIGLNCSTGPEDMRDAIRFLGEHSPVPVHCIPNAGLPLQGPDGETIFPEEPEPLAEVLGEFVERYGVGIVGGCCGTTPEHIAAIARALRRATTRRAAPRAAPAARQLDDRRRAARAGPAPDARRRARQLAGLAQGQGAAAGRRLRRPRAGRRGPGRGRRPRARRLRRADRAPGRGRADAPGRQARLARPSPRRSRSTRPSPTSSAWRSSRSRAARSSTRSTSRPAATSSTSSSRWPSSTAPR